MESVQSKTEMPALFNKRLTWWSFPCVILEALGKRENFLS